MGNENTLASKLTSIKQRVPTRFTLSNGVILEVLKKGPLYYLKGYSGERSLFPSIFRVEMECPEPFCGGCNDSTGGGKISLSPSMIRKHECGKWEIVNNSN